MILANNWRSPVEQLTLNPATRRAPCLIRERGAFNGTVRSCRLAEGHLPFTEKTYVQFISGVICSHRLVVRTSPFHGEDVRANRAESDLYTPCRVAGR